MAATNVSIHHPDPPEPAHHHTDTSTYAVFVLGDADVYIDDPAWFEHVALWAAREAAKLRDAQEGPSTCVQCGGAASVSTSFGPHCAKCVYSDQVPA